MACVLEPPAVGRAAVREACGDAVFVVAVNLAQRAACGRTRKDRALMIALQAAAVSQPCPFIPEQRLIAARAVDIAAQQAVVAVIFRNEIIAVIVEPGGACARAARAEHSPQWIVGQRRSA